MSMQKPLVGRRKIQKTYKYYGLGFPITLVNVPMLEVMGERVPSLNFDKLEEDMAISVALKSKRLTGSELRFLRLHLGMTQKQLGDQLGVTRQAVLEWEKRADQPVSMQWLTEKELRLFTLARSGVRSNLFMDAYVFLHEKPSNEAQRSFRVQVQQIGKRDTLIRNLIRSAQAVSDRRGRPVPHFPA